MVDGPTASVDDVLASYVGGGNYGPATGIGTLTITQATPTVHVNALSFTFNGLPHASTGSVTGSSAIWFLIRIAQQARNRLGGAVDDGDGA